MKSSGLVALVLALAGGTGFGYWLGRPKPGVATAAKPAPLTAARASGPTVEPVPQPPLPRPSPPASPMRALIRQAIERAPVARNADLERYLDSLETRARTQRRVTALEVEPGIAMIQRYSEHPDQDIGRFSQRMQRLQRSIDGVAEAPRPDRADVLKGLGDVLAQIEHPADDAKKQESIARYLELARSLGEEDRDEAMRRLNQAAQGAHHAPDPSTVDALWSAIDRASEPRERQALIADYIEIVRGLPDEEGQERMMSLNEKYGVKGQ